MRIGIEAQRLFRDKQHGMEVVTLELLKQLKSNHRNYDYEVFVAADSNKCIDSNAHVRIHELKKQFYPLWEQSLLPKAAANVDLLHCTSNTAPLKVDKPLVVTIHDVIYLEKYDFSGSAYQNFGNLYRRFIVPRIARTAIKIITVSEYAKSLMLQYLDVAETKISVVHNGVSDAFKVIQDGNDLNKVKEKYKLPEKFILHFGNTAPRKNTIGVINAFIEYRARGGRNEMVISGCEKDLVNKMLRSADGEHLKGHIFTPGYIHYNDLCALYNLANMFVYPSFNEGFGMPAVESMACGTPVITSNRTSLPEVAGNAAILVHPEDSSEIADAMLRLADENICTDMKHRGLANAARFSWSSAADKLVHVYDSVLKSKK